MFFALIAVMRMGMGFALTTIDQGQRGEDDFVVARLFVAAGAFQGLDLLDHFAGYFPAAFVGGGIALGLFVLMLMKSS